MMIWMLVDLGFMVCNGTHIPRKTRVDVFADEIWTGGRKDGEYTPTKGTYTVDHCNVIDGYTVYHRVVQVPYCLKFLLARSYNATFTARYILERTTTILQQ